MASEMLEAGMADSIKTQANPHKIEEAPSEQNTEKDSEDSGEGSVVLSDKFGSGGTACVSSPAPEATNNMEQRAPIHMKLANNSRKSRKRKQHPNNPSNPADPSTPNDNDSCESSENGESDDASESTAGKKHQQNSDNSGPEEIDEHTKQTTPDDSDENADQMDQARPISEGNAEIAKIAPHQSDRASGSGNDVPNASASAPRHQHEEHMPLSHSHRPGGVTADQPEGWRVKLYRLNMDGSWDDCGTGRIVCLYRSQLTLGNNPQQDSDNHNPNDSRQQQHTAGGSIRPAPHQTTDQWLYQETGEATLCVQAELTKTNKHLRVLLRTRILLRDPYQRQGDNIITWCEPFYSQDNQNENDLLNDPTNGGMQAPGGGVDLALSFQDNAGCLDIWRQITQVQSRAAELLRSLPNDESVQRMAAAIAAQHHAHLQQHPGNGLSCGGDGNIQQQHQHQPGMVVWAGNHGNLHVDGNPGIAGVGPGDFMLESPMHLPDPPTLGNLEQIADTIAAIHNVQQREAMAIAIAKDECAYLRTLLALFPAAEERNDYGKLATLAACVKTILLLNEPAILELIVTLAEIFEQVCSCLEYDPDLREKANHRWFLRERVKFRTVVAMDNLELVSAIHRSFRANFLRDTLLRPTMDESSLSTLSSLQTFSHADVVKGVTMSPNGEEVSLTESYLVRVIRLLGIELHAISVLEWLELENPSCDTSSNSKNEHDILAGTGDPSIVLGENPLGGTTWKQYLAPQDNSLSSRRMRRRGCLNFLRELFNMVRLSLQQNDKDDFFSVISTLDIDLIDDVSDCISQTSQAVELGSNASTVKSEQPGGGHIELPNPTSPVSLLSLLGDVLSDPSVDASEKGAALEIIAGVAMHDPSFIRRHCIEYHNARKEKEAAGNSIPNAITGRPDPNEKKKVIFITPPNDLLASLIFLLDVTTDAGVLLQATEIMRIVLDTDIIGDNGSIAAGFKDEADGFPVGHPNGPHHDQHTQPSQAAVATNDQKQFFSLFYEHYMEWLVAPFQFTLLHPVRRVPEYILNNVSESKIMQGILASWRDGVREDDKLLRTVPFNAIRSSFAVELLSFCVRAHLYRMKFFLLKSRVLGNVLALLRPNHRFGEVSGDRCLKLAALRFLRSILSVHDEFYHRHIIQHDLFGPVFAALRDNPVGDNLVSSSIIEMCDYIHNENIKSLIEYIVTKHLSADHQENELPRLEDVSSPYVSTLTVLREAYESNRSTSQQMQLIGLSAGQTSPGGSRYFPSSGSSPLNTVPRVLSGKALEDQRKFQEADEEESYFESDSAVEKEPVDKDAADLATTMDPTPPTNATVAIPMAVDEVDASSTFINGENSTELHRTPRMFSLAQTPLLLDDAQSPTKPENNGETPAGGDTTEGEGSPPSIDVPCPVGGSQTESQTDRMEEDSVAAKTDEMEQ